MSLQDNITTSNDSQSQTTTSGTTTTTIHPHPFDPITPSEIQLAVRILEAAFPDGVSLRYKRIDVQEPIKQDAIPYLEAERLRQPRPAVKPARLLQALFHRLDTGAFFKALLNADERSIVNMKELPKEVQGPIDTDEVTSIEELCMRHPAVLAEIAKLQLPPGMTVCNDPWMYGTDDPQETRRLFQCFMYIVEVADHPQNNHYSIPCKFSPVFDGITRELVRMDYLPGGSDAAFEETKPWKPVKTVQYAHDLLDEPLRTDLKPYIVQQPEGPSFTVEDGNSVYWQKWRFRVGFNNREGLVLYNVTYDDRNVLYRLAVSEMTVPYGDPRAPYHRKQAFDVGDVGFGTTANQLTLGCDCLGHIKYFDGCRTDARGNPVVLKNVVCMHEQDNGLQHKHTNYRSGIATVVRNRQLVLQMICTVANYEYIFAYIFDQAANIELEVRATGILSTVPFDHKHGETVAWGTNVGPGVMAPFHQHMFSLRVDPAIDGFRNTVYYEDSVPMPEDESNPYLVGYATEQTVMTTSGSASTDIARHRVFKIRNDNVINPITYKPVAYKLMTAPSQMLLVNRKAVGYKRAEFATKPIWVTRYRDDELYAAGEFTNQSTKATGVETWVQRNDPVENEDVVLWHTFGLTHNPRIEDFPVMPMERISVMLKPDGFFTKNPALDVPASTQSFNRSTLHAAAAATQPTNESPSSGSCCASGSRAKLFKHLAV